MTIKIFYSCQWCGTEMKIKPFKIGPGIECKFCQAFPNESPCEPCLTLREVEQVCKKCFARAHWSGYRETTKRKNRLWWGF